MRSRGLIATSMLIVALIAPSCGTIDLEATNIDDTKPEQDTDQSTSTVGDLSSTSGSSTGTTLPRRQPIEFVGRPEVTATSSRSFEFVYRTNDVCGSGSYVITTGDVEVARHDGSDGCAGPIYQEYVGLAEGAEGVGLQPDTVYTVVISVEGTATDGDRPSGTGTATTSFEARTQIDPLPVGEFRISAESSWDVGDDGTVNVEIYAGGDITLSVVAGPCEQVADNKFSALDAGECVIRATQTPTDSHDSGPAQSLSISVTDQLVPDPHTGGSDDVGEDDPTTAETIPEETESPDTTDAPLR